MNYLIFGFGLFVGFFFGILVICLLAGPRIAELESTVAGLRTILGVPDQDLVRNVREMDRGVEYS